MARLPIGERRPLREALAEFPSGPSRSIRQGFKVLSELSPEETQQILNIAVVNFQKGGGRIEPDAIVKEFQLSESEAQNVLFTVAVVAATLSPRTDTAKDFVEEAQKAKLLDEEHTKRAIDLAEAIVSQRDNVSEAMKYQSLASEVLPSLMSFDLTIDLRIGFEDKQIKRAVPITVVHLDTDAYEQETWFQLTKPQVESIIDKLKTALENMEKADLWSKNLQEKD